MLSQSVRKASWKHCRIHIFCMGLDNPRRTKAQTRQRSVFCNQQRKRLHEAWNKYVDGELDPDHVQEKTESDNALYMFRMEGIPATRRSLGGWKYRPGAYITSFQAQAVEDGGALIVAVETKCVDLSWASIESDIKFFLNL